MTDAETKIVEAAADKLMEHFDSVRIFVTCHPEGGIGATHAFTTGRGNWFAQSGQVNEWRAEQDQAGREQAKRHET